MVNSVYAAGDFLGRFPQDMLPETTEGRDRVCSPLCRQPDIETSTVKVLIRDFDLSGVAAKEAMLKKMVAATQRNFRR